MRKIQSLTIQTCINWLKRQRKSRTFHYYNDSGKTCNKCLFSQIARHVFKNKHVIAGVNGILIDESKLIHGKGREYKEIIPFHNAFWNFDRIVTRDQAIARLTNLLKQNQA